MPSPWPRGCRWEPSDLYTFRNNPGLARRYLGYTRGFAEFDSCHPARFPARARFGDKTGAINHSATPPWPSSLTKVLPDGNGGNTPPTKILYNDFLLIYRAIKNTLVPATPTRGYTTYALILERGDSNMQYGGEVDVQKNDNSYHLGAWFGGVDNGCGSRRPLCGNKQHYPGPRHCSGFYVPCLGAKSLHCLEQQPNINRQAGRFLGQKQWWQRLQGNGGF